MVVAPLRVTLYRLLYRYRELHSKVWVKKTWLMEILFLQFLNWKLIKTRKFLFLPYIITRVLCGVGTQIFEFQWFFSWEIAKTKFQLFSFFFTHPLYQTDTDTEFILANADTFYWYHLSQSNPIACALTFTIQYTEDRQPA